MNDRTIRQGEIYICRLDDNTDSEQGGERPCLILQVNALNNTSPNTIVVPITSKRKKSLPSHYILDVTKYTFLIYRTNTVLCECIRTLSKAKIGKYIGSIDEYDLEEILLAKENCFREVKNEREQGCEVKSFRRYSAPNT